MKFQLVKLKFYSPFQISKGSVDYTDIDEMLHSDTIKNALFVCAKQLFGDEIKETFFNDFLISSAFPYFKNDFFFPKPFLKLPLKIKDADKTEAKKLKKLQWIEKSLFENVITGKETEICKNDFSKDGKFLSKQFSKSDDKEKRIVYKIEETQRVRIKYDDDAEPFYSSRIHFAKESGLYVLIKTENQVFYNKILKPAFCVLGSNGIGSYKHLGNGQFEPEFVSDSYTIFFPQNATHQMCLSLFCPTEEEIKNLSITKSSYQLVKRGGYLASPEDISKMSWRKKSIYMFQEGSVFPNEQKFTGKLSDVTPEGLTHKVWREGRAIFIPVINNHQKSEQ
jgi:CRISPR-associated protein Csm4